MLEISFREVFSSIENVPVYDPLSFKAAGITIPFFIAAIIIFGSITLLVDFGYICKKKSKQIPDNNTEIFEEKDPDVQEEEERVTS